MPHPHNANCAHVADCPGRGTPCPGHTGDFLLCTTVAGEHNVIARRLNDDEATVVMRFEPRRDSGIPILIEVGPGSHWTIELLGAEVPDDAG